MEKANLYAGLTGVMGGSTKWHELGAILIHFDERITGSRIDIDVFQGQGVSYKRRDQELMRIYQDGCEIFSGTFEELCNKIKNK